jgi:hypothetical protein
MADPVAALEPLAHTFTDPVTRITAVRNRNGPHPFERGPSMRACV